MISNNDTTDNMNNNMFKPQEAPKTVPAERFAAFGISAPLCCTNFGAEKLSELLK